MAYIREASSLEEQLREERRLAAAMRRRRLKRWLLPLLLILAAAVVLIVISVHLFPVENKEEETVTRLPADATATLVAAGDIQMDAQLLANLGGQNGFDFSECFSALSGTVAAADISVVNVEGNFCGSPYGGENASYPDSLLNALHDCGFSVIQTANSYSIENGLTGLISTKKAIEAAGMDALGTFSSPEERSASGGVLLKEVNGIRIAMIGMTKGTNGLHLPEGAEYCVNLLFEDYDTNYAKIDRRGIESLIASAKSYQPDVIVCFVHWGSEYTTEITETQKTIAQLLFDNGVDVIIGSHSHLVGPIEGPSTATVVGTREHGLVAYSLGDLLSVSDRENTHTGCLLCVTFSKTDGETKISDISYRPTYSAYPSEKYGQSRYQVYDALLAIHHYESSYFDHVSDALYEHLTEAVEALKERTSSDYLTQN